MRNRRLNTIEDFEEFERDEDHGGRGIVSALTRMAMRRPLDSLAMALALATSVTIVVNALALQNGAHPAPLYGAAQTHAAGAGEARSGESDPLVADIQTELARRGIYDGPVDGRPGPRTDAAIRSFQIAAGLSPTGVASEDLLANLMTGQSASAAEESAAPGPAPKPAPAAATPTPAPVNNLVLDVQRLLNQRGFGPLEADGLIGEATRGAIRRFEASRGLQVRGEATPEVLKLLKR